MYPPLIKPSGEVEVSFSESMQQIDKVFERDLQSTLQFSIASYEFRKTVVGTWMAKPSEQENEAKRVLKTSEKDGAEVFDRFYWYVAGEKDNGLSFKMQFENPGLISREQGGYDEIDFKILDKSIFRSKNSDQPLDEVRPVNIQGAVPQQMEEEEVQEIDSTMDQQKASVASGGLLTLLVAKLTGGTIQILWGMMAVLQEISFNALVRVKYPAAVEYR